MSQLFDACQTVSMSHTQTRKLPCGGLSKITQALGRTVSTPSKEETDRPDKALAPLGALFRSKGLSSVIGWHKAKFVLGA